MYSEFQHGIWDLFNKLRNANYPDAMTYRQVRFYSAVGPAALPPDQLDRVSNLTLLCFIFHRSISECKVYKCKILYIQRINRRSMF